MSMWSSHTSRNNNHRAMILKFHVHMSERERADNSGECKLHFNKHFHHKGSRSGAARLSIQERKSFHDHNGNCALQFCRHIFWPKNFLFFTLCFASHFNFLWLCQNMLLWVFWKPRELFVDSGEFIDMKCFWLPCGWEMSRVGLKAR